MFKIPALAYFILLLIVTITVNALLHSFAAMVTIGLLVIFPLSIEMYNVAIGKYPRIIKYLILFSLFIMFFLAIFTAALLIAGGPDPNNTLSPGLMAFDLQFVNFSQSFFFLFVFIIDCHILKIFSVITTWVKERYVLWFRNGGIVFIIFCVACALFFPVELASNIASFMGVLVFIFDNILSIYLVLSLVRLKKLNIEMGSVTEAVSFLICIVLVDWFSVLTQLIGSKAGGMSVLTDYSKRIAGVTIASLFSLHFCLAVNAFSLIKELALFKKAETVSLKTSSGMGNTPVKSTGHSPLTPLGVPPPEVPVGEKSTVLM